MGTDLGGVLGQQLAALAFEKPTGKGTPAGARLATSYMLVFGGLTLDDISGIEEYFVAFNGYKLHRRSLPRAAALPNGTKPTATARVSIGICS